MSARHAAATLLLMVTACVSTPRAEPKSFAHHSDPIAPPTACIVDPVAETIARAEAAGGPSPGDRALVEDSLPDVDGDGLPERMLAVPSSCGVTGNCEFVLFLTNGGCPRSAGPLVGAMFSVEATRHHGVQDVSGWSKGGCIGMEGGSTRYEFDGRAYVAKAELVCDCPADEEASRCSRRPPGCPCLE